jgi:hypothetical protein
MDDMDKTLGHFMKNNAHVNGSDAGYACLSEEQFANYLNNLLPPSEKIKVEKHLDECEACFQKSIIFSKVTAKVSNKEQPDIPQSLIEKTKKLVSSQTSEDMVEVVLEFGRNIVNIIKDTADVCIVREPDALSFRNGRKKENSSHVAQLSREFNGIEAAISVEKTDDNECEIEAMISDHESGELLDDIRINLISGKKELASYLTVKGRISFKNLALEKYILKFYKGKYTIGSIKLKLSSI